MSRRAWVAFAAMQLVRAVCVWSGPRILTAPGPLLGLTCNSNASNVWHFTGKERDYESNLDNFGARYDASSLGRFMTPDPLGGKLTDPQSLNRFSYVRNSPLNLTDPTGMYVCADSTKCDSDSDKAFETARKRDLKSKDKKIKKAAEAYGDPTVDNKVHLRFADSQPGLGGAVTFGRDSAGKADGTINVTFSTEQVKTFENDDKLAQSAADSIVAHEGTHVAQDEKLIDSSYDLKFDITHRDAEREAYGVEERVIETETDHYNPDWSSKKAIDKYLNSRPEFYKNLDKPILPREAIPQ